MPTITENAGKGDRALLLIGLIVAVFVANVVHWSILFPVNGVPDERVRFYFVEYILRFGHLPHAGGTPNAAFTGQLSGLRYTATEWWYYGLPNLDGFGSTLTSFLFSGLFDPKSAFLSARMFNWVLSPVFGVFLLMIAREISGRTVYAMLPAICVLAIPQITFVFSYVNSDALALTTCTIAAYALLAYLRSGSARAAIVFGAACGLLLCTKIYYLPAFPAFVLLVIIGWQASYGSSRAYSIRRLMLCAMSFAIVAIPILALTYHAYGDAFGMKGQADFVALHRFDPVLRYGTCFAFCHGDVINGPEIESWLSTIFRSFFYAVGWMDIWLPDWVYWSIFAPGTALLFVAGMVTVARDARRVLRGDRRTVWRPGVIVLFWGVLVLGLALNLVGQQGLAPQPQGRYLFYLIPFLVLMVSVLARPRPDDKPGGKNGYFLTRMSPISILWICAGFIVAGTNVAGYHVAAVSPHLVPR